MSAKGATYKPLWQTIALTFETVIEVFSEGMNF